MNSEQLISLIQNPKDINSQDITALDSLLLEHPYFSGGQLLLAKGLLNTESIRYNRQLKKAAVYSLDRKKLFSLITLNKAKQNQKDVPAIKEIVKPEEADLELGKPLEFDENESHSFSEWMSLTKVKKIDRTPKEKPSDLIDSFIDKKAGISKPKKEAFFNAVDVAKESLIENNDLVTPTLAKVYLEQGHYSKAISAYEKLILKYPEKNSFFANQIKLINKLKEK
jgi:tetratricopeptide (TPR) repeat protein